MSISVSISISISNSMSISSGLMTNLLKFGQGAFFQWHWGNSRLFSPMESKRAILTIDFRMNPCRWSDPLRERISLSSLCYLCTLLSEIEWV
jgi:hypothetical protein